MADNLPNEAFVEAVSLENNESFQTAIKLFNAHKFYEAFMAFSESYNRGEHCEEILEILSEGYYLPNKQEMDQLYEKNVARLLEYPFILKCQFETDLKLSIQLYPVDSGVYRSYDVAKKAFGNLYQIEIAHTVPYYFKALDKPLLIENEFNVHNLRFLKDNVRASEDYGGDNHIYLHYDSFDEFCILLYAIEWSELLEGQKFVFLFGEERQQYYPMDFKKLFGIDYTLAEATPIRIDEVQRIILEMQVLPNSGNAFLQQILDWPPNLLTMGYGMTEFGLFYEEVLKGRNFEQIIERINECLSQKEYNKIQTLFLIFGGYQQERDYIHDFGQFLNALYPYYPSQAVLSKKQWFIAFYLAYADMMGRDFKNERIVPALFYGIHFWYISPAICYDAIKGLLEEFPYNMRVGIIRDPITSITGNIDMLKRNGALPKQSYFPNISGWLLDEDKTAAKYVPLNASRSFLVRFEDLKLNKEATLTRLAKVMNIPFDKSLLETTSHGMPTTDDGSMGFNPSPIYKQRKELLNDFDRFRLELVSWKHYEPFGYKPKLYDGMRYTDGDVRKMLELPFRFEEYLTEVPIQQLKYAKNLFIEQTMMFYRRNFRQDGYQGLEPMKVIWPKEELMEAPLYE